jgi:SagB-type dehydrogenase family enzyme
MRRQPDDRVPARLRLWSLSEDALVEVEPDGDHLVVFTRWGEIRIDDVSPLVRESLRRMSLGPVSVENLPGVGDSLQFWRRGETGEAGEPWRRFRQVLDRLGCCVVQSLGLEGETGPVLSVAPVSRRARLRLPPDIAPERPIRLSRFVALRNSDGDLLLESPLTEHQVVLHRPVAGWVVGSLGSATTVADVSAQLKIAGPVLADMVSYLVASGVVLTGEAEAPGLFAEDHDTDLAPWTHHDLQFHAYSRMGRHSGQSGAVFPDLDRLSAAPVTRTRPAGRRFPLYRPAPADLAAGYPPLSEVVEASGSLRDYSERPVTAEQLGELLFRVARIRDTRLATAAGASYEVSDRPYLSTADLYELELYVSLHRCSGLPRGNYHYDTREHALTLINDSESGLAELLDTAKIAASSTHRPPVLMTITTRIARLSWIYSGIAYSTTLKHVGALQQTLHLTAAAMGLGSRALAAGDGAVADDVLRLEWPTEVSIGEFLVGIKP